MKTLDYGVIGNCRSAALVSRSGSIDWCCLPIFDSPSLFAHILDDEKGGRFAIETSKPYNITQKYVPKTNILSTTFENQDSAFEILDFMPRYIDKDNIYHMPPDLVRILQPLRGKPRVRIIYEPRLNYAEHPTKSTVTSNYIKSSVQKPTYESVYLYSDISLSKIARGDEVELENDRFLLLSYNQKVQVVDRPFIVSQFERTKEYWIKWSAATKSFKRYHPEVERSALTLKLLSYQKTGAMLAAITTSLPETIGEVRNWDYRFCWIRDASMIIAVLHKLGHNNVAHQFVQFILNVLPFKDEKIQIMYGIRGHKNLKEEILSWLSGYEHSKPVRIGNDAYHQKQNDIHGVLIDVLHQYLQFFYNTIHNKEEIWTVIRSLVRHVEHNWDSPDRGIWEFRNESRHFTFSKVLCWVAMDRATKIAEIFKMDEYAKEWRELADKIKKDILHKGWNETLGFFTQSYGSTNCDAANLLMEHYGFIEPTDPKFISTVLKTKEHLGGDGLLFRYKNEDDFGVPKSAFTVCTFWMIRALYQIGKKEEAVQMFENTLSYANHLGLFSEDMDIKTKRLLGNFPQGYCHLALIDTAYVLQEMENTEPQLSKPVDTKPGVNVVSLEPHVP